MTGKSSRMLGLDIGEKRIGAAVTDASNKISLPLSTIENNSAAMEKILNLIYEYDIGRIIVGMPYNLKGCKGFQSEKVMDFVGKNFKDIKIPVVMVDERFTTKISSKIMENKVRGKPGHRQDRNKADALPVKNRDAIAASLILRDYIERVKNEDKEENI